MAHKANVVIIGLGNPILGDDGVGWRVADMIKDLLSRQTTLRQQVDIETLSLGGLSLMEKLIGYDRAILIDAINLGQKPLGGIYSFDLKDLPDLSTGHTTAAHDTSLQTALEIGRALGLELPEDITIIGIEAKVDYAFSEEISPDVARSIPQAVFLALDRTEMEFTTINNGTLSEEHP